MRPSPPPSPSRKKRARLNPSADDLLQPGNSTSPPPPPSKKGVPNFPAPSSFRNVSACNRCRLRKNRCDQNLPACSSCAKAGARCVGFDPITKREIPRTYVYYLESRVTYLESLLSTNHVPFAPSLEFDHGAKPVAEQAADSGLDSGHSTTSLHARSGGEYPVAMPISSPLRNESAPMQVEAEKSDQSRLGARPVPMQDAFRRSNSRSNSDISSTKDSGAPVKGSVANASPSKGDSRPNELNVPPPTEAWTRESFFGLCIKSNVNYAPFPDKELGIRLANFYFEHANPQFPILHRGEFMGLLERADASTDQPRSPLSLYMLNMVFAIGAGIIVEASPSPDHTASVNRHRQDPVSDTLKKPATGQPRHPEEYHASAMMHLESYLGSEPSRDRTRGLVVRLEELQAVLLLAGLALLRPIAPGLWYIDGVAMRLAIDLGLYSEEETGLHENRDGPSLTKVDGAGLRLAPSPLIEPREPGRQEWTRGLRRRLWWCTYSIDRLVSTCVGRPCGIMDQVITTEFPSVLDDADITVVGFRTRSEDYVKPTHKRLFHHYIRLRLLQSEILQVLHANQAQKLRASDRSRNDSCLWSSFPSPFLQGFPSFDFWRRDIHRRLLDWKEGAPLQQDIGVQFPVELLELDYLQAVMMLYRPALNVLVSFLDYSRDPVSPMPISPGGDEDETENFLQLAEASQMVLNLYRRLHRAHLVTYTFLAIFHLFRAGLAFLYAVWHSPAVRRRLTLEDVEFTVLGATAMLGDFAGKFPPATACRDAFDRTSTATIKRCLSTTGFGLRFPTAVSQPTQPIHPSPILLYDHNDFSSEQPFGETVRLPVQINMDRRDVVSEKSPASHPLTTNVGRWHANGRPSRSTLASPLTQSKPVELTSGNPVPVHRGDSASTSVSGERGPTARYVTYDIYGFPESSEFDFGMKNGESTTARHDGNLGLEADTKRDRLGNDGEEFHLFDAFFFGMTGKIS